jgi:hypothetical protein
MANLVETSNNDRPAVTGENLLNPEQLVQIAIDQDKNILEIGSGAGIRGKGIVGVEAIGLEKGLVAQGKVGINCNADDTGVNVLMSGGGVALRGVSLNGVGLEILGGRLAARFDGNVEITGQLNVSGQTIQSLIQRIRSLEQRVARLENPPPPIPPDRPRPGGGGKRPR